MAQLARGKSASITTRRVCTCVHVCVCATPRPCAQAFMFAYSMRDKTHAYHRMEDNVPEDVKARRLREVHRSSSTDAPAATASQSPLGPQHLTRCATPRAGHCHVPPRVRGA